MTTRQQKAAALVVEMADLVKECDQLRHKIKAEFAMASIQDMRDWSERLFWCEDRIKRIKASKLYVAVT